MDAAAVGGAFLSASLQVLFDRTASREFVGFFRKKNLSGALLTKLNMVLPSINVLLEDAEEKQTTSTEVKKWLDELKDVVYEAEDLLDEIATEALQCKVESEIESNTISNQVRNLVSVVPQMYYNQKMESEIMEIIEKLNGFANQKVILGLKEGVGEKPSKRSQTTSLVDESDVRGRDSDKKEIMKFLLSDDGSGSGVSVIAIVGMGGVGKTTLAQLLYNDADVTKRFDLKAWVCVAEEFDVFKTSKTILEIVTSKTCDFNDLNSLQVNLRDTLIEKKFLLVLDNLWNESSDEWEKFLNPFKVGVQGSKIIATMRNAGVASVMHPIYIHQPGLLSHDDCWLVFAKHAFKNGNADAHPDLEVVGKRIVTKCAGLPLVAKALGGLLYSAEDVKVWNKILNSKIWGLPKCSILPALMLSYHYLPGHLKRCFAYCSIFPKDYEFTKEELILLWIAEGFVQQSETELTMEMVGDEYFCDLLSRSFFQRSNHNKSFFSMHDLMSDLAQFVSREFCYRLGDDKQLDISKKARHLSYFRGKYDATKKFEALNQAKCLRSFLQIKQQSNYWACYLGKRVIHDQVSKLECLRVLSLSHYHITELPESIGNLKRLRYLDLSHTTIRRLPDSTCSLYNLQTLMLSNCLYLFELPKNMRQLINLRNLDISGTKIKEMPVEMSRLKSLQTLSTFVVSKQSGSKIEELGELKHLQGTLSILKLQNVAHATDASSANLKEKEYLNELVLEWSGSIDDSQGVKNILEKLEPHTNMKKLTIKSYGGTSFPSWLGEPSFSNLVFLCLSNCEYCWSLPPLGQLSSLKDLSLIGFDRVKWVGRDFYGSGSFASLKTLRFEKMAEWEEWNSCEGDNKQFPSLRVLCIQECPKLTGNLPNCLPLLKELVIIECQQLVASLPSAPAIRQLHLRKCDQVGLQYLSSLERLRTLSISDFKELPGELHSLKSLKQLNITGCPSSASFSEIHLLSMLQSLVIDRCDALESLPDGIVHINARLQHLFISNCSSLRSFPRVGLPASLKRLRIEQCPKLEFLLPEEVMHCYPSLENLEMCSYDSLRLFPLGFFPALRFLEIRRCANLESISIAEGVCNESFTSLRSLRIMDCPNLVSFASEGLSAPNLTVFWVWDCKKLKSLPAQMHNLTSLQQLGISGCPEIECFPEGGLPSNLHSLRIRHCNKLIARRMEWGLQRLSLLKNFNINGAAEVLESFPEEGLLPVSLTTLGICNLPHLKMLDENGLQHLASLEELEISCCPELRCMPNVVLPTSLSFLEILKCPLLKPRCQRDKGEDWPKIAHIPFIQIDDEMIS